MARTKNRDSGEGPAAPSSRRIENIATDKTVLLYANNAQIEASNWDVKLKLGLVQSATTEVITVTEVAHIYMSHEHAKAFHKALGSTIEKLEVLKSEMANQSLG